MLGNEIIRTVLFSIVGRENIYLCYSCVPVLKMMFIYKGEDNRYKKLISMFKFSVLQEQYGPLTSQTLYPFHHSSSFVREMNI